MTAPVDVLLVLAADVSPSINEAELALQRQGYAAALQHAAVVGAIRSGPQRAIGVAYLEWSGLFHRDEVVPWARLASARDAARFAATLRGAPPPPRTDGTSIVDALSYARRMIEDAPWDAERRTIDLSGDGVDNNDERLPVEPARDAAVADGITINALAIEGDPAVAAALGPGARLSDYFRRAVIGGPGAFVMETDRYADFALALRRKLVREIAGLPVSPA